MCGLGGGSGRGVKGEGTGKEGVGEGEVGQPGSVRIVFTEPAHLFLTKLRPPASSQVPVSNLLGQEHQGFKCIMHNFNHERWFIVAGVNRGESLSRSLCPRLPLSHLHTYGLTGG